MQKLAPSVGRLAVIAVFALSCFGLLLFLWISFGGSVPLEAKGYRINIVLPQANSLAVQADVRISGVTVGTVVGLNPSPQGQTIATIQLQRQYAPLHADTRVILRAKTLLGETFVALTPGSRSAPAIPEGGTLGSAQVAPSVQLDDIYRTFDAKTRAAFQTWMQASAAGVQDQGGSLNAAIGDLDPLSQDLEEVAATLQSQNGAVSALVRNTGIVFDALDQREGQLKGLISASRATFGATAAASSQLAAAFHALPTFEQRSQAAFHQLDQFAADASPLLTQLEPAEEALTPALQGVRSLSPSLAHLATAIGPLTSASRKGLPALDGVLTQLKPLLGSTTPVLRNLNPLLAYGDLFQPELEAFFANTAAASEGTVGATTEIHSSTQQLHALRALTGQLNPTSLALQSQRFGSSRTNAYAAPGAFNQLASGLEALDTSSCSNATPGVSGPPSTNVTADTLQLIQVLKIAGTGSDGTVATAPCKGQPAQTFQGLTGTFPRIAEAAH